MSGSQNPLTRSAPLGRGSGPARKTKSQKPTMSLSTAELAITPAFSPLYPLCACGCGEHVAEWHHAFDKSRYPELVDVAANVFAVATRCHRRHTDAVERFPRLMIGRAEALASTPAMENYLGRTYRA